MKRVPSMLKKHRYLIGIVVFTILTMVSFVDALYQGRQDLITVLSMVTGFFLFMVIDRMEQAEKIDKLQESVHLLVAPLHDMRAEQIKTCGDVTLFECQRLTSMKSFEYVISKVKSARRTYNTSFASDAAISGGAHYNRWLNAIVDGVTEHDAVIHEATLSSHRLAMLRTLFEERGKPMKGSYVCYDLSLHKDALRDIPFVEFTIFENQDDTVEVIFGWTSSNLDFLGAHCFLIKDEHAVSFFLAYLRRIESLGTITSISE
jgi:hypothetical protein